MSSLLEIVPSGALNGLSRRFSVFLDRFSSPAARAALLENRPFPADVGDLGVVSFDEDTGPLSLASQDSVSLSLGGKLGADLRLRVIAAGGRLPPEWTSLVDDKLVEIPTGGELLLFLTVGAHAHVKLSGTAKSSLLQTTFGVETTGVLRLARVARFGPEERSREVLATFFERLRWPLQAPASTDDFLPGEVVCAEVVGDLKANLRITAGFEVAGSAEAPGGGAKPVVFNYRATVGAFAAAGVTVTGAFRVVTKFAGEPGWVRVRIKKESSRGAAFSAGVDVGAEWVGENLPENTEAAVKMLLGIDVGTAREWLDVIAEAADKNAALQAISDKLSPLVSDVVAEALGPIVEGGAEPYAQLKLAVKKLRDLPDDVAAFVVREFDSPAMAARLEQAAGLLENAAEVLDGDSLDALWSLVGDALGQEVLDPARRKALAEKARRAASALTTDLGEPVKAVLNEFLERTQLGAWLDQAEAFVAPADLQAFVQGKTGTLVAHLLGIAKTELGGAISEATFTRAKEAAAALTKKIQLLDAGLKIARKGKLELSLAASIERVRSQDAVFDAEVNLGTERGAALLEKIYAGDLTEALDMGFDADALPAGGQRVIRLKEGVLTDVRSRTSTVTLVAGSWSWQRSLEFVRTLEEKFVERDGGLVLVQTLAGQARARQAFNGFGRNATLASMTLLRAFGEGSPNDRTVTSIVDFESSLELVTLARNPDGEEIARVLESAQVLGLVDDVTAYQNRLALEFGSRITKLQATYRVGYAPGALREALRTLPEPEIAKLLCQEVRAYIAAAFAWGPRKALRKRYREFDLLPDPAALFDDALAAQCRKKLRARFPNHAPGKPGLKPSTGRFFDEEFLSWHGIEIVYLLAFKTLCTAAKGAHPTSVENLFKAFEGILTSKPRLASGFLYGSAPFFIMDRLIRAHQPAARLGRTGMILEISTEGDRTTRRHFLA